VFDRHAATLRSSGVWHGGDQQRFAPFVQATAVTVFRPGEGLPGRIVATGEPAHIDDVRLDPNFPRSSAAVASGLVAAFGFPIVGRDGVAGAMEFFDAQPAELDAVFVDLISHIGHLTGHLIEKVRLLESLVSSESRLAEAQQLAGLGSWSWEVDHDTVTWSDELYRIYGLTPGQPISFDDYLARIHPDDRDWVAAAVAR